MPPAERSDPALTAVDIAAVAAMTGICRRSLWEEVRAGRLRRRKVGRRAIFVLADVRAWLDAR